MSLFLSVPIFMICLIVCIGILIFSLSILFSGDFIDFLFGLIGICFLTIFVYWTFNMGIAIYTGDYSTINKAIGD